MKFVTATPQKLTSMSLLILLIPFLFFITALLRNLFNLNLPPDAWLEKFSQGWSPWWRVAVFAVIMILLPTIAVVLNLLSAIRIQNENRQPKMYTGIRLINFITITLAGSVAILFSISMIAD